MESDETKGEGGSEAPPEPSAADQGDAPELSEAEMRQLEEQLRKVRIEDVILQGLVPVLNLAARRIAKDDERDLAQGKAGIDAAQAMLEFVPEEARPQIQQAISELQLLYAKYAGEGGEGPGAAETPGGPGPAAGGGEPPKKPGGTGDSGLWTPGGH